MWPCLRIRSTISAIGRLTSTATMSMRGIMTSRTVMSPISMIPWIISRSSSSMIPSSSPTVTSIFSSSSVTKGPRTVLRLVARAMRRAKPDIARSSGRNTLVSELTRGATASA